MYIIFGYTFRIIHLQNSKQLIILNRGTNLHMIYTWLLCSMNVLHFLVSGTSRSASSYSSQLKWTIKKAFYYYFHLSYFGMKRDDVSFRSPIPHKGATSKLHTKNKEKKDDEEKDGWGSEINRPPIMEPTTNHRKDKLHNLTWPRSTMLRRNGGEQRGWKH